MSVFPPLIIDIHGLLFLCLVGATAIELTELINQREENLTTAQVEDATQRQAGIHGDRLSLLYLDPGIKVNMVAAKVNL